MDWTAFSVGVALGFLAFPVIFITCVAIFMKDKR